MSDRYRHTRKIAGLTLGHGARLLGIEVVRLSAIELARTLPTEDEQRKMCDAYGCSIEWLRGDNIEPPADLVEALRDRGVEGRDRDTVLEFAAMIKDMPPKGTARERINRAWDSHRSDSAQEEADRRADADLPIERKRRYVRSQGQTRNHHCHWPGCEKQVPPAMWGCKPHWFKLPKALRDRIWRTYAPGQEVDMTPSAEYLQVADDVQRWIRESGAA